MSYRKVTNYFHYFDKKILALKSEYVIFISSQTRRQSKHFKGNYMNNSIFNSIHSFTNAVRDDVKEAMGNFTEAELYEMDASDLVEYLMENHYTTEVIYYHEAWDVVAGSQFNDFNAEYLDFSNCKNSIDCVMQEANGIIYSAYYAIASELAIELLSDAHEQYEATLND